MAKNDFQYGGWNYYTPCNVARSWHWFRQMTAPFNVACGSGIMTVKWTHKVAAPCNVIHGSRMTCRWIRQVAAPSNVAGGSGMTCHGIRPNVRRIGILHLVSIMTISPQSTCHYAPVCEILSKSDYPQQKKWRHVDFQDGGSQPSWILWVQ